MITVSSFQIPSDGCPALASVPEDEAPLASLRRDDRPAVRGDPGYRKTLQEKALKAALDLLVCENRSLQETLLEERKFCTQLRQALEQQRQAAITDPLTGLYNRRAMDQRISALLAERASAPLSVLMLDIDHLKQVNDTYGHAHGDSVIRHVAGTLSRSLRTEDSAYRYGGEEFMVLLPNTSMAGAITVAETIRSRIEHLPVACHPEGRMACTVSLGVASRRQRDDLDSLFKRADHALYQAKRRGRNRVVHEAA